MAAIITPRQESFSNPRALRPTPRPKLVVVPGGGTGGASVSRPVPLAERIEAATGLRINPLALGAAVVITVVVMALSLAVGHGVFAGLAPAPPAAAGFSGASDAAAAVASTVVVQPGDTLWGIARRIQPNGDARSLVDALQAAHGGSAVLVPGERIVIPR